MTKDVKRTAYLTTGDILARKKERRHELASLFFGRKVLIVKVVGKEIALIRAMRTKWRENRLGHDAGDVSKA